MKTKLTEGIIEVWYHIKEIEGMCRKLLDSTSNYVNEMLKNS